MAHNYNLPFKVLRQISQNIQNKVNQEKGLSPELGYFRNNGQSSKNRSIYTEECESRMTPTYTIQTQYQEEEDEDIYEFLQKQKTLKERIYHKLSKNKQYLKINNQQQKQATFRPTYRQKQKENTKRNNPSVIKNKSYYYFDDRTHRNNESKILTLSFHQRQKKTIQNRQKKKEKLKTERSENQTKQCTFRPKLTNYKPKRV